ncbi:MAG: FkbM family methyltransferase, partial [Chromatiales bacterium]|nr:FkbM family methyltransferase [Chromatiales bacterium]
MQETILPMHGDILVSVPNNPHLMTAYILTERGDWFEDEVSFLRNQYLAKGMKVLDIGANYGMYTLSLAKSVGTQGRIWAIEPASKTVEHLRRSLQLNGFEHVELLPIGLSKTAGVASLYLSENAELNSMALLSQGGEDCEQIQIQTLDETWNALGRPAFDFIKMDAEGEEINIINAGSETLAATSPLLMYELKHGDVVNIALITALMEQGYWSYRLIPGLNVLVPFNHEEPHDPYLLNLFACKSDTRAELDRKGIIVSVATDGVNANPCTLPKLDYLSNLGPPPLDSGYGQVFSLYVNSRRTDLSNSHRMGYLDAALNSALSFVNTGALPLHQLSTIARIAYDAGMRAFGNEVLNTCLDALKEGGRLDVAEAFVPPNADFENLDV